MQLPDWINPAKLFGGAKDAVASAAENLPDGVKGAAGGAKENLGKVAEAAKGKLGEAGQYLDNLPNWAKGLIVTGSAIATVAGVHHMANRGKEKEPDGRRTDWADRVRAEQQQQAAYAGRQ